MRASTVVSEAHLARKRRDWSLHVKYLLCRGFLVSEILQVVHARLLVRLVPLKEVHQVVADLKKMEKERTMTKQFRQNRGRACEATTYTTREHTIHKRARYVSSIACFYW